MSGERKPTRRCGTSTCSLKDIAIKTDATECVGCGQPLPTDGERFLSGSGLADLFGKGWP